MDLAKDPSKVGDRGERMDRDDGVERVGVEECEVGEANVVDLDVDLGHFSGGSGHFCFVVVWVDCDDAGALSGESDRGSARSCAELEDALVCDFTEESPVEAIDVARTKLDNS